MRSHLLCFPSEIAGIIFAHVPIFTLAVLRCDRKRDAIVRGLTLMRRAHAVSRLGIAVRTMKSAWLDASEALVLKGICEKLRLGAPMEHDPSSLKQFNKSIRWLENYHLNDEFLETLLYHLGNWSAEEQLYVDHWEREFIEYWCLGWHGPSDRIGTSATIINLREVS